MMKKRYGYNVSVSGPGPSRRDRPKLTIGPPPLRHAGFGRGEKIMARVEGTGLIVLFPGHSLDTNEDLNEYIYTVSIGPKLTLSSAVMDRAEFEIGDKVSVTVDAHRVMRVFLANHEKIDEGKEIDVTSYDKGRDCPICDNPIEDNESLPAHIRQEHGD